MTKEIYLPKLPLQFDLGALQPVALRFFDNVLPARLT